MDTARDARTTAEARAGAAARVPRAARGLGPFLAAAVFFAGIALPCRAGAAARPVRARVVWARADHAYLAVPDSLELERGDRLTFLERRRPVAFGEVTRVLNGALAVVRIPSGALEKVHRLDRLSVLAERPVLVAPRVLRVGYPSPARANLVFSCGSPSFATSRARAAYRPEWNAEGAARLVREPGAPRETPWPDTLIIRLFGDAADEEIALERRDLDVAVFWPGELSSRMREDARWRIDVGVRARGVIAAVALTQDSAVALPSRDLGRLERFFRDDLVPWTRAAAWAGPASEAPDSQSEDPVRVSVGDSWPGRRAIERLLDRAQDPAAADEGAERRLVYLDVAIASPESLLIGAARRLARPDFPVQLRAQADTLRARLQRRDPAAARLAPGAARRALEELGVRPLFAIGCPLVSAPEDEPLVRALGASALVDLLDCPPAGIRR